MPSFKGGKVYMNMSMYIVDDISHGYLPPGEISLLVKRQIGEDLTVNVLPV